VKFYFTLQFKRIYRHIDEFGVIPFIGFAILIAFFCWISEALFKNIAQASYIYISIGLLLSIKLGSVKRNTFLKKCFPPETYWKVRLLENTLFALPFSGFLCYKQAFIEIIIFHVGAIATSFFNTIGIRSYTIPTPFGKKPHEFVIGFRTTFWIFPLVYTLACIAISVGNYNLGLFSLIILFGCCMSYYSKQEPLYYIWIHSMSSKEFLTQKIKTAILFSSILVVPIAIGLAVFFPLENLQITLLFLLLGFCFIIVTILGKYSNYPSQVPILQVFAMLLSLFFPPLLCVIIPFLYKRATKNLNSILTC